MSDGKPSAVLEAEHQRIDEDLAAMLTGQADAARVSAMLALLRRHVYVEEEILFGPIAAEGLAMPVYIMQHEHGQMWPVLNTLADLAATGDITAAAMAGPGQRLKRLFAAHNPKEEDLIYAVADRLAEAGNKALRELAPEQVRVPTGWTCMAMRPGFAPPPGTPPWQPLPPDGP